MPAKSKVRFLAFFAAVLSMTLLLSGCKSRIKKIQTFIKNKQTEEVSEELATDPFKNITVDVLNANLSLRYGSSYQVKTTRQKRYKLVCEVNKKTLTIKDAKIGQKGNATIEVIVPLGAKLKDLNISTTVGNLDLKKIKAKKADLYCGVGNLTLKKCNIKSIAANADVGTITYKALKGIKKTTLNLSVEEGNVYLRGNSRGQAFAKKKGKRYISSHVETGDIKIE